MNADQIDFRARRTSRIGLIWLSALAIGALGVTAWVQSESMAQRQWPEPQPADWSADGGLRQNAPVSPAKMPFRMFRTNQANSDPFNQEGAEAQWQLAETIKPLKEKFGPTPDSPPNAVSGRVGYPWPKPIDTAIDYGNRAVDASKQLTQSARQRVNQVVGDTADEAVAAVNESTDKIGQLADQVAQSAQETMPRISLPNMQDGKLRLPTVIGPGVKRAIQQRLPEGTPELPKLRDVLPEHVQAQLPPVNPPNLQRAVDVAKKVMPEVPPKLKVPDLSGGALKLPDVTIPKPKRPGQSQLLAQDASRGQVNLPAVNLPNLPQASLAGPPHGQIPTVSSPDGKPSRSSLLPAIPPVQPPTVQTPTMNVADASATDLRTDSARPPNYVLSHIPDPNLHVVTAPEITATQSNLSAVAPVEIPHWNPVDVSTPDETMPTHEQLPAIPPVETSQWNLADVSAPDVTGPASTLPADRSAETPQRNLADAPAPRVPAPPFSLHTDPTVQTQPNPVTAPAPHATLAMPGIMSRRPPKPPSTARPVVAVPRDSRTNSSVAQIQTPRIHIPKPPQIQVPIIPDSLASTNSSIDSGMTGPLGDGTVTTSTDAPLQGGAHTMERSRFDLSRVKLPHLGLPTVQVPEGQQTRVESPIPRAPSQPSVHGATPNATLASQPPMAQPRATATNDQWPVAREHPEFAQFAFPKSPVADIETTTSDLAAPALALSTPPQRQASSAQLPNFHAPHLLTRKPSENTPDSLIQNPRAESLQPPTRRAGSNVPASQPTSEMPGFSAASVGDVANTTVPPPGTPVVQPADQSRTSAWGGDTSASNSGFVMPDMATPTPVTTQPPQSTMPIAANQPNAAGPSFAADSPLLVATSRAGRQTPSLSGNSGRGELVESSRVLAIVGDQPILSGDVIGQVNQMLKQYEGQVPAEELAQQRQMLVKQALPSLIDNKLIFSDFMRNVPDDKLPDLERRVFDLFAKEELPKLIKKSEVKTARELDAKLRQVGSSIEKQRRLFMEKAIAQQMVRQNVQVAGEVKHDELLQYYEEHLGEFKIEARAKFEHLMVRFDKYKTREEALNAIATMGNQVLGGAPSAEVAKRSSHGPLASQGGVYDWTTKGSLASDVMDKALFSLPIGRWSKIMEDADGLHIMRVTEREPAGEIPFTDVQSKIAETIQRERFQAGVQKYLARLRASTHVWTSLDEEGATEIASPPSNGHTLVR